jgi:hypothetical protein
MLIGTNRLLLRLSEAMMKKTVSITVSLLLLIGGMAGAASIGSTAGTTAGEFLRLGAGARAAAMGEAFGAVADDVYSLYWNPGGLANIDGRQALLAHTMWFMDVNHEYAAYAQKLPGNLGAAGISVTYLMTSFEKRSGDTDSADSSGNVGDMAVGVTYARPLVYGINGGVTAKYISSTLDADTAVSAAFDIGLQKRLPFWGERVNLGLSVLNLGGSLKYISDAVAIGNTFDLGVAVRDAYIKNLKFAVDYRMMLNSTSNSVNAGIEYAWQAAPDITILPRAGFESQNSSLTAGFGFCWKQYELDYAFLTHADLGTANRISFNLKF